MTDAITAQVSVTKENRNNKVPSCLAKASLGKKHLRWDLNGEKEPVM